MANTWHLTEEEIEELDLPWSCTDKETVEEHRWYDVVSGVFRTADGKYWRINWCDPASEQQEDIDPFDDYVEPIATEVVQKEVLVFKWVEA